MDDDEDYGYGIHHEYAYGRVTDDTRIGSVGLYNTGSRMCGGVPDQSVAGERSSNPGESGREASGAAVGSVWNAGIRNSDVRVCDDYDRRIHLCAVLGRGSLKARLCFGNSVCSLPEDLL